MRKASGAHGSELLSIGPDVLVWDGQEVWSVDSQYTNGSGLL